MMAPCGDARRYRFLGIDRKACRACQGLRRLAWLIVAFALTVGAVVAGAGAGAGVGDVAGALIFAGAFAVALPVAFAVAAAAAAILFLAGAHVIFAAGHAVANNRDRADYGDAVGTLFGVLGGIIAFVVAVAAAVAGAVAIAFAVAGVGAFAGVFAFAVAFAVAVVFASTEGGSGSDAVAVAFAIAVAFAGAGTGAGAGAFAVTVVGAIVVFFMEANSKVLGSQHRSARDLSCHASGVLCQRGFAVAFDHWQMFGPQLLFLGPVTLITALFGWLSLGVARALMRRPQREKWWPYLCAFIDALLALVVMAFLAVAMAAAVQLFDCLAAFGGGKPVFPPMLEFLDAIKADPGNPEYWWIYATLFSIMLPSLINLLVAGISLARGVPGVSSWLMGKVREGEAVPAYDRLLVAMVLALDGVAGLAIALVAQGLLFRVIIWQGMPRLGMGVLDLARYVAH